MGCICSERFARSAGLLAGLASRPSSKSAWPIQSTFLTSKNRNEAGLLDIPSGKSAGRQAGRFAR